MSEIPQEVTPSAFAGLIGAGRRDITPPIGIYARMWGAATHDRAEGIHRPLNTTALAFRASPESPVRVLVGIDCAQLGDIGNPSDGDRLLAPVREALGLSEGRLLVNCSHTHSAPWSATSRSGMPGGELIAPYLDQMGKAILEAAREAVANLAPATLTWATGRCDLATNRDLPDPEPGSSRILCGYNPAAPADDTLVVGRVTSDGDDSIIATIVNYACHPTTLAWKNRLISPDYIGAMREVVEGNTGSAPCLFLQGASGELSPAHQYSGDTEVADRHGRRLGFSAMAALSSMLEPGQRLSYDRLVESGAPLAVWSPTPFSPSRTLSGEAIDVRIPLKPMPTVAELEEQRAATDDRVLQERLFRKTQIVKSLGGDGFNAFPAWVWRLGQSLLFAHPNEAYSCFQEEIRAAFPECTVAVMNTSGPEMGYLYPPELEHVDIYQVWQTPFATDALPTMTAECIAEGRRLFAA